MELFEIGVGCYGLSGAYGAVDVDEFKRTLRRAYDLGINIFDTAEGYGDAETILGEATRAFRDDVLIATKVGMRSGNRPDLSGDSVRQACDASLRRLGTDRIDLYQVHFDDPDTPVAETIEALDDLVRAGKIRRYGVGHLPADRVVDYLRDGNAFSVLMELSAVAREARQGLLPLCQAHDVGAIAFSVTGRGLLTGKFPESVEFEPNDIRRMDPLFQRERFRSGRRVAAKIAEVGQSYGKTPVQTAIAWVLAQPQVICALTGCSTVEHLEENVGGSGWRLSQADLEELERCFVHEDERLSREQRSSVKRILEEPLRSDPWKAFVDLIYAMETSLTLGLTTEREILPIFQEVYGLRHELGEEVADTLALAQHRLRRRILE